MTSGEREMTGEGVALLLREAAGNVELGAVPYAEVVRGGMRRKARRRAAGTMAALALTGCAGLFVANLTLSQSQGQVAAQPQRQVAVQAPERYVASPLVVHLTDVGGKRILMEVWGAPRTDAELRTQKARLVEQGLWDERAAEPHKIGDVWRLVYLSSGGKREIMTHGVAGDSGFASYSARVGSRKLAWGNIPENVKRVVYNWRSGDAEAKIVQVPLLNQRWFAVPSGKGDKLKSVTMYDEQNRPTIIPK